ncbi:MAG: SDR family oxidoreductase [Calditrichales bacterium]|nr:MAG: SDR family oxidoreductase [Calditrichales bacterium]
MSSTYLVTGGAGFIGSNIAEHLANTGQTVRVIDNFLTGKPENISTFKDKIDFIEGDIRSLDTMRKAVEGVDYVIHQAALPSVPKSVEIPLESNDHNINGTLNVLVAARDAKVKRVIYAASSAAYGDTPTLPKVETMPTKPLSPYAVNKLAAEYYCSVFTNVYGLETVSLRYFNVFGPRQDPTSFYSAVIPLFIKALLEGKAPTIYGDGEQSRDFSYIDNIVSANLLACTAEGAAGQMFNIACGDRISLNDLYAHLQKILGVNIPVKYAEERTGDIKHSLADINKAEKILGYKVKVSVRDGLEKTVNWFREYYKM